MCAVYLAIHRAMLSNSYSAEGLGARAKERMAYQDQTAHDVVRIGSVDNLSDQA
jgi:hypothetical protein